jgi:predicted SprT family Zn-dependent metalloprotease
MKQNTRVRGVDAARASGPAAKPAVESSNSSDAILQWINFACERCECPELAQRIGYTFDVRLTQCVGQASWRFAGTTLQPRIELATRHWNTLTDAGKRSTVIHETCHIIADWLFGVKVEDHGVHWKWLMRRCGESPDTAVREHEVKKEFRAPPERFLPGLTIVRCGCTGHRKIPNRLAQRIRSGERRTCEICRQPLRLS